MRPTDMHDHHKVQVRRRLRRIVDTPCCLHRQRFRYALLLGISHRQHIYVLPCIYFTVEWCLFQLWRLGCGEAHKFTDRSFPPNDKSLGRVQADIGEVEWKRWVPKVGRVHLVDHGINPNDVCQGALGNCWLLSAAACMAEHKGAVQQLFLNKQANPRGKYRLWLFDVHKGRKGSWRIIVVDDLIPVSISTHEPVFSRPNGNEHISSVVP